MTKTGRNDKCPCGSGKKYKKCCLNKANNEIPIFDLASLLHRRCIIDGLLTEENTEINFLDIYNKFCKKKGFDNIKNVQADDVFFHDLLKFIEEMIIGICTHYSAYELFFWYRRIKPTNRYHNRSVYNYHELIKQSIFMFGHKREVFEKIIIEDHDASTPVYISNIKGEEIFTCKIPHEVTDVLSSIYKLESLCYYYIYVCNCYRIFNKGGRYSTDENRGFTIEPANIEIEFLINYYDERLENQSLLTNIGSYSNEKTKDKSKLILACLYHNFDLEKQKELKRITFSTEEESLNFLIGSINLIDYYEFVRKLNPIIFQKLNFYIEDILSIILYFSFSLAERVYHLVSGSDNVFEKGLAVQAMQRAYTIIEDTEKNRREYVDEFKKTYSTLFPHLRETTTKNILNAYEFLFFKTGNYHSLENESLRGFLFNKITKDKIFVDYTAFIPVLRYFLTPFLSIDGDHGNLASTDLEMKVNEKIANLYGTEAVHLRGEIKNNYGEQKELDAVLIIKQFMFIFECKSLSVSEGSILGTKNSIEFRKNKIKEYLSEVEEKADFVMNNEGRLNKIIPSTVKYIIPAVITSFPEYIWEKTDNLFISETLSRILTINELNLIKATSFDDLKNKPFVRRLNNV